MDTDALREALERVAAKLTEVIDDSESQHPGGWGPDVTTVAVLREARGELLDLRAGLARTPEPQGEAGLRDALDALFALVPEPGEYFYIEARVGSENYRDTGEVRFVVDRRSTVDTGPRMYENDEANDRLARIVAATVAVRAALRARTEAPPATDEEFADGPAGESRSVAWAILYEDPDHGNETFVGYGAEAAARRRFEQARQTWNCTLFRQYAPMGWATPTARGDQPPPEAPRLPLDVETLARALQVGVGPKRIEDYNPADFYREYAEAIATEYARLRATASDRGEGT